VARDEAALVQLVARCVELKARIVARDPHERGPRRALNLGHTFAHAIEHVAGYGVVPHGIAVAAGLALALELAARSGVLADAALLARVRALATALGLPASLDELRAEFGLALAPRELAAAMRSDKKSVRAEPRFVLPVRAGKLELRVAAAPELVLAVCAPAAKQGRARRARARRARRMRSSPKTGS
jgi:3-dehydroquinate synthase